MIVTIKWEYSSEYGDFDVGSHVEDLPEDTDWEAFCKDNYPEDDFECGGYHFVSIKAPDGKVLYSRGGCLEAIY